MGLCSHFLVYPKRKEPMGSAVYLLLLGCSHTGKEGFVYLQQEKRALQRQQELSEKCRKCRLIWELAISQNANCCELRTSGLTHH